MQIRLLLLWMVQLPLVTCDSKGFRLQMLSQGEDGSYDFSYDTGDGTYHIQSRDTQGTVTGKFAYVDPDGRLREVGYRADERGFQPEGDILPPYPSSKSNSTGTSFTVLFPQLNGSSDLPIPPEGQPVPGDPGNNILNPKLGGILGPPRIDGALVPPLPKLGSSRSKEKRPTGIPMLLEERTAMALPGKERFDRLDPPPRTLLDPTTSTTTTTKRTTSKSTRSHRERSSPIPIAPLLSTGQLPISYTFRNVLTTQPNVNAPSPTPFPQERMNNHRLLPQNIQMSQNDRFPSSINEPVRHEMEFKSPFLENEGPPKDSIPNREILDEEFPEVRSSTDIFPPSGQFPSNNNQPPENLIPNRKINPFISTNLPNQVNPNQLPMTSNIRTSRGFTNRNHPNLRTNNFHEYRGRIVEDSNIPQLSRISIDQAHNNPLSLPSRNINSQFHSSRMQQHPISFGPSQKSSNFEIPSNIPMNPTNTNYPSHLLNIQQTERNSDNGKTMRDFINRPDIQPQAKIIQPINFPQNNPVMPQQNSFQDPIITGQPFQSHGYTNSQQQYPSQRRLISNEHISNSNRNNANDDDSQVILSLPVHNQFSDESRNRQNPNGQDQFHYEMTGASNSEQDSPILRSINIEDEIPNQNKNNPNSEIYQQPQQMPSLLPQNLFSNQPAVSEFNQQQFQHEMSNPTDSKSQFSIPRQINMNGENQHQNENVDISTIQQQSQVMSEFSHQSELRENNQEKDMQKAPYMTVRYNIQFNQNPQNKFNVNPSTAATPLPINANEPNSPSQSTSLIEENMEGIEMQEDKVNSQEEKLSIFDFPHPPTREPPRTHSPSPGVIPPLPISRAALESASRTRLRNPSDGTHTSFRPNDEGQFNPQLNEKPPNSDGRRFIQSEEHSFPSNVDKQRFDIQLRPDVERSPLNIGESNERIPDLSLNPLSSISDERVAHSFPESSQSFSSAIDKVHSLQPRHMQHQPLPRSEKSNSEPDIKETKPLEPSAFLNENTRSDLSSLNTNPSSLTRTSQVRGRPLTFSQAHIIPVLHRVHLAPHHQLIKLANSGSNLQNSHLQSNGQSSTISSVTIPLQENKTMNRQFNEKHHQSEKTLTSDEQASVSDSSVLQQQKNPEEAVIKQSTILDNSKPEESDSQTPTPPEELRPIVHKGPVINSPLFTPIEALRTVSGKEVIERTYVPLTRRYGYFFRQQPAGFR